MSVPVARHLILVVDDDPTLRILAREALEQAGFTVEEAADGAEALAACERIRPDLVLLDVDLPKLDGFTVCTALRRMPRGDRKPVLMMTALDDIESISRAYEAGATDFVTKPVNWVILSHRVRYMIRASQTVDALRLSEARLAEAQRIARLGHWELDLKTHALRWSDEVYRIYGLAPGSREPSLEKRWRAVRPDDRARVATAFDAALAERVPYSIDYRQLRPDGQERFVHEQAEAAVDEATGLVRIVGTLQDITERKRTEDALRQSEERFSKAFHASPDAITIRSLDGRYIDVNDGFLRLSGYRRDDVIGRAGLDPNHWVDPDEYASAVRLLLGQGVVRDLEASFQTKSGERRDALMSMELIELEGEPCVLAITRDVTERKQLEAQLTQSQKMEAIGNLAGGIAHDFNNRLCVILGQAELAIREVPQDSRTRKRLEQLLTAGNHARDLVRQILAFSRRSKPERKPVRLGRLVEEALTLLRASLPSTIEIRQALSLDVGSVLADPTQMHQILMNLCSNAEHAMHATGGALDVRLDTVDVDAACAAAHPGLNPGRYVRLTVRDSGHGMTLEVMERIFEPFFTTKGVREGTGMGLAVTHGIVANHGGAITVSSAPNCGTTFEVYLPQIDAAAEEDTGPEESAPAGNACILFVDDEPAIAQLGREMLECLGYRCQACSSADQALEAFRAAPQRFDLVITDQTMPKMTGEALIGELRGIRPDLPIILCTGYSHTGRQRRPTRSASTPT